MILSERLMIHPTVTKRNLCSKYNVRQRRVNVRLLFFFLCVQTGNHIGDKGAFFLSEMLKVNTSLNDLDLSSD